MSWQVQPLIGPRDFPASTDNSPLAQRDSLSQDPVQPRSGLSQKDGSSEANCSTVEVSCRNRVPWKKSVFWAERGETRCLSSGGDCCQALQFEFDTWDPHSRRGTTRTS